MQRRKVSCGEIRDQNIRKNTFIGTYLISLMCDIRYLIVNLERTESGVEVRGFVGFRCYIPVFHK